MIPMIHTERVSKQYRGFEAVHDVSLNAGKGEIYGFIGLNGAGKTTTIRMLLGMVRPTAGACFIDGERIGPKSRAIWERVGYMVETPHAYPELTVRENLDLFRRLRLIRNPEAVARIMDRLQLTRYADKKSKHLSLGNAQRLGIAKAMLHEPDILILDEPANGLDPAGMVEIRELLQDLALNKGVTFLISSHLLDEVAKTAGKIGIIHEGRLIEEMMAAQLKRQFRRRLMISVRNPDAAVVALKGAGYPATCKGSIIEVTGREAIDHPDRISTVLVRNGAPPLGLAVEEENLETYFLRLTEKKGAAVI